MCNSSKSDTSTIGLPKIYVLHVPLYGKECLWDQSVMNILTLKGTLKSRPANLRVQHIHVYLILYH